jgi:hypothetical protein
VADAPKQGSFSSFEDVLSGKQKHQLGAWVKRRHLDTQHRRLHTASYQWMKWETVTAGLTRRCAKVGIEVSTWGRAQSGTKVSPGCVWKTIILDPSRCRHDTGAKLASIDAKTSGSIGN